MWLNRSLSVLQFLLFFFLHNSLFMLLLSSDCALIFVLCFTLTYYLVLQWPISRLQDENICQNLFLMYFVYKLVCYLICGHIKICLWVFSRRDFINIYKEESLDRLWEILKLDKIYNALKSDHVTMKTKSRMLCFNVTWKQFSV